MAYTIYVMWIHIHITDQRGSSDLLTNPEKMDFYHVFISSLDLTHWRALVAGGGTPTLKMLVSTLTAPDTSEPAVTWFISESPQHALRAAGVPQDWESSTLYLRLIPPTDAAQQMSVCRSEVTQLLHCEDSHSSRSCLLCGVRRVSTAPRWGSSKMFFRLSSKRLLHFCLTVRESWHFYSC